MKVLDVQKKGNIAYGSQYIHEDLTTSQSSSGVWDIDQNIDVAYDIDAWSTSAITAEEPGHAVILTWNPESSLFTQSNLLDKEEAILHDLVFHIKTSFSIAHKEKIVKRLDTLLSDAKEEDSSSIGIAIGSLYTFYNFMQLHNNLKYPAISLTPDNNIYASWRGGQNRIFSVLFLPNWDTRFVVFKPNDKHPERKIRIAGTATIDKLMEEVSPKKELDWIFE